MQTKNKIEKLLNQLVNNKEIHDNFFKYEETEKFFLIYFNDLIYSGQFNILNIYKLQFYIQNVTQKELILYIYK